MKTERQSTGTRFAGAIGLLSIAVIWQLVTALGLVPEYMLPSPVNVIITTFRIMPELMPHMLYTLRISLMGFALALIFGVIAAVLMDKSAVAERLLHPLFALSQTVPVIAIAPLYVLWFGYGLFPKLVVVVSVCFFPITVALLDGLKSADGDLLTLLDSMGAGDLDKLLLVKFPSAASALFAALRISATYCVMGAVVAEWLGGDKGIGVYMIRAKRAFAYGKLFSAVLIIILLSLALILAVRLLRKIVFRWEKRAK